MNNEVVIKELNAYLKAEYTAIHAYENYIHHAEDESIKKQLQQIQQEHKMHAAIIAERIQDLGGKAVNDNGIMMSIQEGVMNIIVRDQKKDMIQQVIKAQNLGIEMTEKIVRGDLDPDSKQLIEMNLNEDRNHLDQLNNLIH